MHEIDTSRIDMPEIGPDGNRSLTTYVIKLFCIILFEYECLVEESLLGFQTWHLVDKQQWIDVDEWNLGICKKHDDEIVANANKTLVCDEAVRGRYLVIQFQQITEYFLLCEVAVQTCKYRGNNFQLNFLMGQVDERIHYYIKLSNLQLRVTTFQLQHHRNYNIDSCSHYVVWL